MCYGLIYIFCHQISCRKCGLLSDGLNHTFQSTQAPEYSHAILKKNELQERCMCGVSEYVMYVCIMCVCVCV